MEEVIICVALCLFMNGELVEHTYQKSMSDCLKAKRVAMRIANNAVIILSFIIFYNLRIYL